MRILEFEADKQLLRKAPGCDFSNIVPGTSGYLFAKFAFSEDWLGCVKVAVFQYNGQDHAVKLEDDACKIPSEALAGSKFKVSVKGARPGGYCITSTFTTVRQEG